jgi:hypothetical protein
MSRTAGANAFTPPPDFDVGRGKCAGVDTDMFFPRERDWVPPEIQLLCDSCPVEKECLSYAVRNDLEGIWGGTSWMQRVQIRRVVVSTDLFEHWKAWGKSRLRSKEHRTSESVRTVARISTGSHLRTGCHM